MLNETLSPVRECERDGERVVQNDTGLNLGELEVVWCAVEGSRGGRNRAFGALGPLKSRLDVPGGSLADLAKKREHVN